MNQSANPNNASWSRLPIEGREKLLQMYSVNPYPDRFQIGIMARQYNLSEKKIKNWFDNRRARDCRKGKKLCRQCRFFKSSEISDELHQKDPYTRHCMLSSISNSNQEQLEGYARQIQHFVNHQRTATELSDCLQNGPRPVPFSSHRPIIHQQYQLSSFQLGEQQQTTPCMLHPTLKNENENQENDYFRTTSNDGESNVPFNVRQITRPPETMNSWPSSIQNTQMVSHSWMFRNVAFPMLPAHHLNQQQESNLLLNEQPYYDESLAQQNNYGYSNNGFTSNEY